MFQRTTNRWTANRILALVLGIVFTLLGIIGFFTPPENSTGVQAILGIFDSDLIHNIFYLITGLLGIAAAFTGYSRTYNRVFGVVYVLLGLLGLIPALYFPAGAYGTDRGLFLGLTHLNAGDHILHLIAGLLALAVGFLVTDSNTLLSRRRTGLPL
jgi:heme/copper-type cytochrome/quinol oxidase subunit 3